MNKQSKKVELGVIWHAALENNRAYLLRTEITKSHLNNRICQLCGVKTSTVTPSFYYVFNISLSCNINIPSFIGNLWWVLLLENHLKKTTTATVTASSPNKTFNETNTLCAGALCVSSNISFPSSGKQREMTKFCVVWRMWTTTAVFLSFYFEFIVVSYIQFRNSFDSDKQSRWLESIARFVDKI